MISASKTLSKLGRTGRQSLCDARLQRASELVGGLFSKPIPLTAGDIELAEKALRPSKTGILGIFRTDPLAKQQKELQAMATAKILEHVRSC
jgi:hypothetical protein